ncbi:MAG TPA: HD domain-containing protein, partial [Dehalococcoidia bacterium]|nr:HD domain-containing protein [Dehalococcoidia bacterium]
MNPAVPREPERSRTGPFAPYLECRRALTAERSGDGGTVVCRLLTETMDACLSSVAAPLANSKVAVVALGGYGRAELCLHSDIDLIVLHAGRLPAGSPEAVFYPLWDAGLKVGHSVRSVNEAVTAARERLETLTALLDARLVTGDSALLDDLLATLGEQLRRGRIPLTGPLAQAEQERREREPFQLLAADLKSGRGGLRTLQALHWDRRSKVLAGPPEPPLLPQAESDALGTLLRFRNALHAIAGSHYDLYAFDLRPRVASWLGLEPDAAGKSLYTAMRTADILAREYWNLQSTSTREADSARLHRVRDIWRRHGPTTTEPSESPGRPVPSPLVLAAQTLDSAPHPHIFTPDQAAHIQTPVSTPWDDADRAALVKLLAAGNRGWDIFTALETLGWVDRVFPEWRHVVATPQHTPFHLHPLDTHLWRTVIELLAITRPSSDEPWCSEVAAELVSLDAALLSALLHDIGKGLPGDHSATGADAAAALLRRAGFGPSQTSIISGAVRHHLLLPTVATRRDIDDPRVVRQVADQVGDLQLLRILYLLSVADARATGPLVWSSWKASLIRTLFSRAVDVLTQSASPIAPVERGIVAALQAAVAGRVNPTAIGEHIQAMPPGYPDAFDVPDLVRHLDTMVPPPAPGEVRVNIRIAT